ncbi:MAG: hypothetical protein QM674_01730 [Burkholderiaceae bacterium]
MTQLVELLRRKRSLLLKAYILHVGWFASTCAFAASDAAQIGVATSLWLTLLTVPPVLFYTVSVHKACRAIDPSAKTAGWVPVILFTIFLTPLESGLILPAKNLLASRRILRTWDRARTGGSSRSSPTSGRPSV